MEVKLFLGKIKNKELLKIKKFTNMPISTIKNSDNPFFSYVDFEDFEKNSYGANYTNDFVFFKDLIIFLQNEHIDYFIEDYNNLEDLINDYTLNIQITKANDVLDRLREKYPNSESWEENINNEQKFFININGVVCDGIKILKENEK